MARFTRDAPSRPDSVRVREQGGLWVEVAERPGRVTMTFHGALDGTSLELLRELLHEAEHDTAKPVLADLADATFGRGGALRQLLEAAVRMQGRLTVHGAPAPIQDLVTLTLARAARR